MPRGRRPKAVDLNSLEAELASIKSRQLELRRQIRQVKGGDVDIRKLQEKLEKQLAGAKWIVQEIHQLRPNWDDVGFYQSVKPVRPTPRGRRPRQPAE